jgi:putative transposase
VRYGYRRLHVLLRREGWRVNHTRVYRRYRQEGLGIQRKRQRKRVSAPRVLPPPATQPLERWSLDFLSDSLADGRRFRVLTIVDNVSRVSPAMALGTSLPGERVVALLDRLRSTVGVPQRIAIDNGPEFISQALDAWAYRNGVQLEFSRPGKPTDNAFAESFNGRFRDECLNQHWFASLEEARQIVEAWRIEYNTERPHRALGQATPAAWMTTWGSPSEAAGSPFNWTKLGGRSVMVGNTARLDQAVGSAGQRSGIVLGLNAPAHDPTGILASAWASDR